VTAPIRPRQPGVLGPVDAPPRRRAGSVRRTATTYMTWPDGIFNGLRLTGRCRDIQTVNDDGDFIVLADQSMEARTEMDRTVRSIVSPDHDGLAALVGARAGNALRSALGEVVPDLRDTGAPLYLLLDDMAGTSLIAGAVWSQWREQLPEMADLTELRSRMPMRSMEGICAGFAPGSSALNADGTSAGMTHFIQDVPPLVDADDPDGWHDLPSDMPGMAMRRARRIDVWRDNDELRVDAMFRDSCWLPDGSEVAIHEYHLLAAADADGALTTVVAEPRILPFRECPAAAPNAAFMVGASLSEFRTETLDRIKGTDCCTHLNDALRALAEVPILAAAI
jgi:DUF2889 family protein